MGAPGPRQVRPQAHRDRPGSRLQLALDLTLRPGWRVVFLGLPGAGKTRLQWELLAHGAGGSPLASAVIFDSKRDPLEWASWGPQHGYVVTTDPDDIRRHPRVIYQVEQLHLDNRAGWGRPADPAYAWTRALTAAFNRGHTINDFDDAIQTLPLHGAHPQARRTLTQGRSLFVSTWIGAQRPRWLDPFALRLAEVVVSFTMPSAGDRVYLTQERGVDSELLADLGPYEFAIHVQGASAWRRCAPADIAA